MYKVLGSDFNFSESEIEILKKWKEFNVFTESVNKSSRGEFVFYDGPPFANGLPHYGHLLTGYIKDSVARFQTMLGNRVERRFGWDCHGLPVEMEVEKETNIRGSHAIKEFGIEHFNRACKQSVQRYTKEWEHYVDRSGRWVDFENKYRTMDLPYMESVIWAFGKLYEKGLVYEDYRVMPYSWKCETPLSNFETRLDNAYREKVSKSITVKFVLKGSNRKLLVWTTTPWTLPANLAVAVHRELTYVEARCEFNSKKETEEGEARVEVLIVEKTLFEKVYNQHLKQMDGGAEVAVLKEIKGEELIGLEYEPLFPFFADMAGADGGSGAFRISHADFVNATDGTGIVHIAPAFGEDDHSLCKKNNIPLVCPVDSAGKYTAELFDMNLKGERIDFRWEIESVESERLYAIKFSSESLAKYRDELFELYTNPEVRKYYDNIPTEKEFEIEMEMLEKLSKEVRFTRMLWFEKSSDEFVAFAGLNLPCSSVDEIQYGVMIREKFWNLGFGREIQSTVLEKLGRNKISAYVAKENEKVTCLLSEGGFRPTGERANPQHGMLRQSFEAYTENLSLVGRQVFDCNDDIIRFLKGTKNVVKVEQYKHNYPHCWRTDTPLIYKAVPSWYVNVESIKDRMVELNAGTLDALNVEIGDLTLKPVERLHFAKFSEMVCASVGELDKAEAQLLKKDESQSESFILIGLNKILFECERGEDASREEGESLDVLVHDAFARWTDNYSGNTMNLKWSIFNEAGEVVGFAWIKPPCSSIDTGENDKSVELALIVERSAIPDGGSALLDTIFKIAFDFGFSEIALHCSAKFCDFSVLKELEFSELDVALEEFAIEELDFKIFIKSQPKEDVVLDRKAKTKYGINWIPDHVKSGLFGKWIKNARDWSITRNRFWGCPVPVWKSTNVENKEIYVLGSVEKLEEFFAESWASMRSDVYLAGSLKKPLEERDESEELPVETNCEKEKNSTINDAEYGKILTDIDYQYVSEDGFVIHGVLNEDAEKLRELFNVKDSKPAKLEVKDLHRPFIDKLVKVDPLDSEHMIKRVEDVLDCWFESGSMPFASVHYPFQSKEWFDSHFPGDFIVEYSAQTRGWFYTMTVLGVALFDTIPFLNCICHGVVLNSDGQKLSKKLKNYPDPLEIFKNYGSDAVRWLLLSSPVASGGDLLISKDDSDVKDITRLVLKPIVNAYNFFAMYANADDLIAEISYDSQNSMDKYIMFKMYDLALNVEVSLEKYDFSGACASIEKFIDSMNNWYIRRNKNRFWKSDHDSDKRDAYNTLYTVLLDFCKVIAPLLPFLADTLYLNLTESQR